MAMQNLLKSAREKKGITLRELAQKLKIDPALISKFESGNRMPTKEQVIKLASALNINTNDLLISWLKEKIFHEVGRDHLALQAIIGAKKEIKHALHQSTALPIPKSLLPKIQEIDTTKKELDIISQQNNLTELTAIDLAYIYESARIGGSSLTLKETNLILNQGLTLSGKNQQEHLDVICHKEALTYVKKLALNKTDFTEQELLTIHRFMLSEMDQTNAGKYRKHVVTFKGSKFIPPDPSLIREQVETLFAWYNNNKDNLHPIVLASEVHLRLLAIYPFDKANEKTCHLVMNLILLKYGYLIARIKSGNKAQQAYHHAIERALVGGKKKLFLSLIIDAELNTIRDYKESSKKNGHV
ncbi:MAG: helix-turn-helix domain-containing protein [Bacteroidetes bacterium]|nr:MAG: helix-turn-helix domain-containing protein [Bacteroidota bacterium]